MPTITVLPDHLTAQVAVGEMLLDAAEKAGAEMEAGCFHCNCGTCVVEVVQGLDNLEAPSADELEVLDQWSRDPEHYRLACCSRLKGDVTIRRIAR